MRVIVCDRCKVRVSSINGDRRHVSTYSGVIHEFDFCADCFKEFYVFLKGGDTDA